MNLSEPVHVSADQNRAWHQLLARLANSLHPWTTPSNGLPTWARNHPLICELVRMLDERTISLWQLYATELIDARPSDHTIIRRFEDKLAELLELAGLFDQLLRKDIPIPAMIEPEQLNRPLAMPIESEASNVNAKIYC